MTAQRNHYEVLGVSPTANTDQIKTKYREMARMFHPDVAKDKALAQKMFTQINQAYRVLADPERRARYDSDLRAAVVQRPVTVPQSPPSQSTVRQAPTAPAPAAPAGRPAPGAATGPGGPQALAVTRLVADADFALMNGDTATALAHAEAALRLDPQHAQALGLLGDALAAQGRREEAAAAYRRSLQVTASLMIQAKLDRLGGASRTDTTKETSTGTVRPPTTPLPSATPSSGLLSRLLGRNK